VVGRDVGGDGDEVGREAFAFTNGFGTLVLPCIANIQAGYFRRNGADIVEGFHLLGGQSHLSGGEVVVELFHHLIADDHAHDRRLG